MKEKALAMFKFIDAFINLREKKIVELKNELWFKFLKDIPSADGIKLLCLNDSDTPVMEGTRLLSVRKQEITKCPRPNDIFLYWLEAGWDNYYSECTHKNKIVRDGNVIELFEDNENRKSSYANWKEKREKWAAEQKIKAMVNGLYSRLRTIFEDIKNYNKQELFIADGVLVAKGQRITQNNINPKLQTVSNVSTDYPLLLKKVKIDFDAKNNTVYIEYTDDVVKLYTDIFESLSFDDISLGNIKQHEIAARNRSLNPWNANDVGDFFKIFVNDVCTKGQGQYIEKEVKNDIVLGPFVVFKKPLILLRNKKTGAKEIVKEVIEDIEKKGVKPGAVADIFSGTGDNDVVVKEKTLEQTLAATSGDSLSVLLAKKANKEQLEIAERIETCNGVLVQGPPGTGKTHTIANLIGHFIAQGKSVLVTSEKEKALAVIKEKLPESVQQLCVSLIGNNRKDLENSIEEMLEYRGKHSQYGELNRIKNLQRERKVLITRINDCRTAIYASRLRSHQQYVYDGIGYSANEVGEYLGKNEKKFGFIPGIVTKTNALPLTVEDLTFLYESNGDLTREDIDVLQAGLPDPEKIISCSELASFVNKKEAVAKKISAICDGIGCHASYQFNLNENRIKFTSDKFSLDICSPKKDGISDLVEELGKINRLDQFAKQLIFDGAKGHSDKIRWSSFFDEIERMHVASEAYREKSLGQNICLDEVTVTKDVLVKKLEKLAMYFEQNGSISKYKFWLDFDLKKVYGSVKINNEILQNKEQCNLVLEYIQLCDWRQRIAPQWDELIIQCEQKPFNELDCDYQERVCASIVSKHRSYLSWYDEEFVKIKNVLSSIGIIPQNFYQEDGLVTDEDLEELFYRLTVILPPCLEIVGYFVDLREASAKKTVSIAYLKQDEWNTSEMCKNLLEMLSQERVPDYEKMYMKYINTYEKLPIFKKRNTILDNLQIYAKDWAGAIKKKQSIHGEKIVPGNLIEAWKWKQFELFFSYLSDEHIREQQKKIVRDSNNLRNLTEQLVCTSAWYYMLKKFDGNSILVEALNAWKQLRVRVGKTRTAKSEAIREQGKRVMEDCQLAVPAWVMTVDEALTSFSLSRNAFDVIIIDESSQSDLTALPLLYMAKKVIVVGDDKQVSPLAVGVKDDEVHRLAETYLKEFYHNSFELFDVRYSLYDFASLNYKPLMLREHFRCVPDIIEYCNGLSYNGRILPLREANSTKIIPAMVQYRVPNGARDGRKKVNAKEAESIVALFLACLEQPEYQNKTFGIISLLGMDQVKYINSCLYAHVDGTVTEKVKMLVGDSASFQGDERDVIFASMVDNSEDVPLRKKGEGQYDAFKKRYNVAVSRAKDQFWVVHSLDYKNCLNKDDLRRGLLEYIENPNSGAGMRKELRDMADSEFEIQVGNALIARGFAIEPQHAVGSYRIDLIIRNTNIAIECDGEAYHSGDERVRSDMERQTILERLGWKFARVRGSEYFRHEEECIDRLIERLEEMGAQRSDNIEGNVVNNNTPLLQKVKIRANQILIEWNGELQADGYMEASLNEGKSDDPISEAVPQDNAHVQEDTPRNVLEKIICEGSLFESTDNKFSSNNNKTDTINGKIGRKGRHKEENKPVFQEQMLSELELLGAVINRIEVSNTVWVLGSKELSGKINTIAKRFDVSCTFEAHGSWATGGRPGWIITRK